MKKFFWINVLVIAFAMIFVTGCSKSPSDAVEAWQKALCNQKVDEANKYSTARVKALNGLMVAAISEAEKSGEKDKKIEDIKSMEIVKEEINGDKAVVTYKTESGKTETIDLVKEDGEWKVDIQK